MAISPRRARASDIQNVTAQLAANGVENYDKLAEAAGNLNAVAGGNKETFSSVGMVLTQTAGQGKLTTENFNQLSDAIPGASGKIQEALLNAGAYAGNFREALEKGEVTAQEFNDAVLSSVRTRRPRRPPARPRPSRAPQAICRRPSSAGSRT